MPKLMLPLQELLMSKINNEVALYKRTTKKNKWVEMDDLSIHRFQDLDPNNEWLDLLNSPTTRKSPMVQKYQTPKSKDGHIKDIYKDGQLSQFQYTPVSELDHDIKEKLRPPLISISNWDIFWKIINTILGKDKLAKVSQYSLKLLIYHAQKIKTNLLNKKFDYDILTKSNQQIFQFLITDPTNFFQTILLLLSTLILSNLSGLANGLGIYRQFLRFGKSPFKIRDLARKFDKLINFKTMTIDPSFFTRKTIGDFTSLYYCIHDEMGLLYKLKVYRNKSIQQYCSKHDAIGWYSETILALYNTWDTISSLSQQEMDLKIQIQVKKKAKLLSKQILSNSNFNFSNANPLINDRVSAEDLKILSDIKFKKNSAWLDVYKNLSDLIFNTYTVFNIALPFDTLQIWMGISASTLSTIKIYRETKRTMIEQELAKLK